MTEKEKFSIATSIVLKDVCKQANFDRPTSANHMGINLVRLGELERGETDVTAWEIHLLCRGVDISFQLFLAKVQLCLRELELLRA